MIVEDKKVVSIVYELRKDSAEGEIVEALAPENPLVFLFGSGNLLPRFEDQLSGLKSGDDFSFNLKSEDAYGELQENAVVDVPKEVFKVDGEIDNSLLKLGNTIPMLDSEGRRLNGIVKEIGEQSVKMDFNHPMAGANLYFNGKVTDVREANEDELTHGHVHSSGSCEGCDKEDCHSKENDHGHEHHHHH